MKGGRDGKVDISIPSKVSVFKNVFPITKDQIMFVRCKGSSTCAMWCFLLLPIYAVFRICLFSRFISFRLIGKYSTVENPLRMFVFFILCRGLFAPFRAAKFTATDVKGEWAMLTCYSSLWMMLSEGFDVKCLLLPVLIFAI